MLRHFTPDQPGDGNTKEFLTMLDRSGYGRQLLAKLTHDKTLLQECAELAGIKPGIEIEINSGLTMKQMLEEKRFYMVHPDFRLEDFPIGKGEPRKTRLVFLNFSLPREVKKLKTSEIIREINAGGYRPAGTAEFIGLANWILEKGFSKITFPFFEAVFLGSRNNYIRSKTYRSGFLSLRWAPPISILPILKKDKMSGIALILWESMVDTDMTWPRELLVRPKKRKILGHTLEDVSNAETTFAVIAKES